jgi:murein DD-endopeptidase MepM/ murein hydrolase activator NlpD
MPILQKPLKGNPPITQLYGENPQNYPATHGHNGIDWGIPNGTLVYAAQDGLVTVAALDMAGYGNHVRIQHSDCLTIYGHLQSWSVKRDDKVRAGDLIGYSDNTGNSTGPHLHFEVRLGSTVQTCTDPLPLLVDVIPRAVLFRAKVLPSDGLNVRTGPGINFGKVGWNPPGTVLDVIGIGGDYWVQLATGYYSAGKLGIAYLEPITQ